MEEYLKVTDVIDWDNPEIIDRARQLAANRSTSIIDFPAILAEPLPIVISALRSHDTWDGFLRQIPDLTCLPESW